MSEFEMDPFAIIEFSERIKTDIEVMEAAGEHDTELGACLRAAHSLIVALEGKLAIAKNDWISVKDRLPDLSGLDNDEGVYVLVCSKHELWSAPTVAVCFYGREGWSNFDSFMPICRSGITHWMALPKAPGEFQESSGRELGEGEA